MKSEVIVSLSQLMPEDYVSIDIGAEIIVRQLDSDFDPEDHFDPEGHSKISLYPLTHTREDCSIDLMYVEDIKKWMPKDNELVDYIQDRELYVGRSAQGKLIKTTYGYKQVDFVMPRYGINEEKINEIIKGK